MHPMSANPMQISFLDVIFSPNSKYAIIKTYMGASDNNTAAKDRGTVFMDSL
jgi:hypothetical protein